MGLDPDLSQLPQGFDRTIQGIEAFLATVIDCTQGACIAYKPNISFFEGLGLEGLHLLKRIRHRIPQEIPVILDAKRGDIGNTSRMQARFIFEEFEADATTLHPYMGHDSLVPFFEYRDKYHFVLVLTSNSGASDLEKQPLASGKRLFEHTAELARNWHRTYQNIGFVVGATQTELETLRHQDSETLFLVPGVGEQGGDWNSAVANSQNQDGLTLINVGRGILYQHSIPWKQPEIHTWLSNKFSIA